MKVEAVAEDGSFLAMEIEVDEGKGKEKEKALWQGLWKG